MNEFSQSGANKPIPAAGPLDCTAVEAWLAEAAEGQLTSALIEQIQEHAKGCADCREKLALARRGREWLLVLKQENLEPPADLVARILARTSGSESLAVASAPQSVAVPDQGGPFVGDAEKIGEPGLPIGVWEATGGHAYVPAEYASAPAAKPAVPVWQRSSLVVLRHKIMEPRLALVAAMAFFSISLTLNLVGIHITKVRAADLQPQNLRRAVTRHYAEANAHVVRYYENLRIVYEVEARVQQLRRAAEAPPPPEQSPTTPHKGSSDSSRDPGRGEGSQREGMAGNVEKPAEKNAVPADPAPIITGPRLEVAFPNPRSFEMLSNFHVVLLRGAKGPRVLRKTAGPSTSVAAATSGRDDRPIYETTSTCSISRERGLA